MTQAIRSLGECLHCSECNAFRGEGKFCSGFGQADRDHKMETGLIVYVMF